MNYAYGGGLYPDVLFAKDFLKNVSKYPSIEADTLYDPRSINGATNNCQYIDPAAAAGAAVDKGPDSPDDFLEPGEIKQPGTLAEQILSEMARGRCTSGATGPAPTCTSALYEGDLSTLGAGVLDDQFEDNDVFAIDGDSRDADTGCTDSDIGNNVSTFTVRQGEGSILWDDYNFLEPHISGNSNVSILKSSDTAQAIYVPGTGQTLLHLTPGKSYTIIVGGTGNTVGNYELRIRKMNPGRIRPVFTALAGTAIDCELLR
jgi:hypothetical protein